MLHIGHNSSMQMLVYQPFIQPLKATASLSHCCVKSQSFTFHTVLSTSEKTFFFKQNLLKLLIIDYGKTDITNPPEMFSKRLATESKLIKKTLLGKICFWSELEAKIWAHHGAVFLCESYSEKVCISGGNF